ncbi:hypothetical protein [Shewanella pealeana]|uniref:Uncharacterized protein n=1 Tax=Shewanella pealeana (strain ATCC 700345 / ANG-SQ1) TaxID=398579 RepID=A8H9W9_SHEPA|nr:hypothetical protein [Shewanella pealeana]ABV89356.1 hypothetical protein Spea_4046 [Shewanella pealeana ATCC 700345]
MNITASIQDAVLTPFTRSIYQKASLVIGLGLLICSCFYDAQAFSIVLTGLVTVYVIVSFAFKPKLRQHIYLKGDSLRVLKSARMSGFDKWVFGFSIVIAAVSNTYALANITMVMVGIVAYQICLFSSVYRRLHRRDELVLPLTEKYLLLKNKQSNCLLLQRFDIYLLKQPIEEVQQAAEVLTSQSEVVEQAIEFVGSISLEEEPFEGDDAEAIIAQLNQHLSITIGNTVTKKSWRASVKPFLFAMAGLYTYVFLLPDLFKAIFPVGRYRNKFGDVIYRTESMSDLGVIFMMVIMFIMLALPCFAYLFSFYSDVKSRSFKAVCTTKDAIWLLTPAISGHESREILRAEMAHISWADVQAGAEDVGPPRLSIDGDIKLIGNDNQLISLNGWAWSGRFILNHLVKLGLPVRLVRQDNQLKVE